MTSGRLTNADLRATYKTINERYFKGELPKIPIRFMTLKERKCPCGEVHYDVGRTYLGVRSGKPNLILINDKLSSFYFACYMAMVVLHECVHVEHPDWTCEKDQDPSPNKQWYRAFQNRMFELAKAGAFVDLW